VSGSANPKLQRLEQIILQFYSDNKNAQGILFCKTRETTTALMNWMKATPELAWLNPHNLVGASSPQRKDGILKINHSTEL
jgi:ERCC4-related helicase